MNTELQQLSTEIDDLIKASSEKEAELLAEKEINYSDLAIEAARRNGYLECKNLIYKYL